MILRRLQMFYKKYREIKKLDKSSLSLFYYLKYFFRWEKYNRKGRSALNDEQAWITFPSIDYLNSCISENSKVFEYGSGGSTLFFLRRVQELITVEHDRSWFQKVTAIIETIRMEYKWKGFLIEGELMNNIENYDISNPDLYLSDDMNSKNKSFRSYCSVIDRFNDNYFDVVLVDGRARPSCLKHAITKIKKDGFLVLDNSNYDYYLKSFQKKYDGRFETIIDYPGPCPYSVDFTKTSIWRKK